jgi:protein SCO1/2
MFLAIALALCVAAALVAVGERRNTHFAAVPFSGTPLDPPKAASDFVLTDGAGRSAHLLDANKPLEFLFFGYTHCPDECPLALASLARAYRSLTAEQRARVRVVFVTVDPERDTAPVIERYVVGFDPQFIGLTGTRAQLQAVWNAYGVAIDAKTKDIGHGDAIYAIDGNGRVVLIYTPDARADGIAKDARRLVG